MCFNNVGEKIKTARKQAGLSQGALAKRAGIAQSTLSYIEKGEKSPTMDTMASICDGLSVSLLDLLMTGEPDKDQKKLKNNPRRKRVDIMKSLEKDFSDFKEYVAEKYGI